MKKIKDIVCIILAMVLSALPVMLAITTLLYLRIGKLPAAQVEGNKPSAVHYVCVNSKLAGVTTPEKGTVVITYPDGDDWWRESQHTAAVYRVVATEGEHISHAGIPDEYTFGEEWLPSLEGDPVNSIVFDANTSCTHTDRHCVHGFVPNGYVAVVDHETKEVILLNYDNIWGYAKETTFFPFLKNTALGTYHCFIYGLANLIGFSGN